MVVHRIHREVIGKAHAGDRHVAEGTKRCALPEFPASKKHLLWHLGSHVFSKEKRCLGSDAKI